MQILPNLGPFVTFIVVEAVEAVDLARGKPSDACIGGRGGSGRARRVCSRRLLIRPRCTGPRAAPSGRPLAAVGCWVSPWVIRVGRMRERGRRRGGAGPGSGPAPSVLSGVSGSAPCRSAERFTAGSTTFADRLANCSILSFLGHPSLHAHKLLWRGVLAGCTTETAGPPCASRAVHRWSGQRTAEEGAGRLSAMVTEPALTHPERCSGAVPRVTVVVWWRTARGTPTCRSLTTPAGATCWPTCWACWSYGT